MTSFFTQLKKVWGELKEFKPINMRGCGFPCACNEYKEQDRIMRFLKGLNDTYFGVRS